MSILKADYFDGKRSTRHPVSVMIGGGKLRVVGRDVNEEFDARRVRRSLRIANTPRWLYLPGGGACVTSDNAAVDRITRDRRYEILLHRWESRPIYAALAIVLVVAALWLLIDRVLPAAVEQIAERIPVETEVTLGRETLKGMEKYFLRSSTLPPARGYALRAKFDAMVRAAGDSTSYRLEFRSSPAIGPNAFALPSGIIVVTDELVRFSRSDREVLAVLAHELGHVRHRHTMRRLLEGSATALIIAGVTGDIMSAASLAAAAPALLLQTKYSRDNERQADVHAIRLMRKSGIDPRHLTAVLTRLENDTARHGGLPTFLSSHPSTEERQVLIGQGAIPFDPAEEVERAAVMEAIPDRPKLNASDPVQWHIVTSLELQDFRELERMLWEYQQAFEKDPAAVTSLENAYAAMRKVRRSMESTLDEWVRKYPSSYVGLVARASFYDSQALDARGTAFRQNTPDENIRAMQTYFEKAQADLERSLKLTKKPYMSYLLLMSIARTSGNRRSEKRYFLEAVKLAPESVELRLAHMIALEPRWGGSYAEMEAFVAESRPQLTDVGAVARLAARIPAYRGYERQVEKDYGQALKHFDQAISLYASAGTLCERSYALSQLKRDAEAFEDVKLALSKARDVRYCLERAVAVAASATNVDEAIKLLTLVIEVDPNSSYALNQRGWKYQQAGNLDLSFQDYRSSARLGDAWGQLQVGKLYWAGRGVQEDREEAIIWLRKAAAQGSPEAKNSLEQALQQLGQK